MGTGTALSGIQKSGGNGVTVDDRELRVARELGALEARVKTCEARQTSTDATVLRIDSRLRYLEVKVGGIFIASMVVWELARWWIAGR
jgi:hypothetical protein